MSFAHFSRTKVLKVVLQTARTSHKFPEMPQRARRRQSAQDWKELEILWVTGIA